MASSGVASWGLVYPDSTKNEPRCGFFWKEGEGLSAGRTSDVHPTSNLAPIDDSN